MRPLVRAIYMKQNFEGSAFRNKAAGFDVPVGLPAQHSIAQARKDSNRSRWEKNPMRYDVRDSVDVQPGTPAYCAKVDRGFLGAANHSVPSSRYPFDSLIPYYHLKSRGVLEIGVGRGTYAQLIAPNSKSFTGLDLRTAACASTRRRFELAGIPGTIFRMDAENMSGKSAGYTKSTRRRLMVCLRDIFPCQNSSSWWTASFQSISSGPLARSWTRFRCRAADLKNVLADAFPDAVTRFLADKLRFGTFLIARLERL